MGALTYYAEAGMEDENRVISRGLRSRDPQLLDRLIEQYQNRLFRYLVFFTRDRELAEDLFQETWIRILEKGSQFDPRHKFESWLLTVARNLAIDQMRRRGRLPMAAWRDPESDDSAFDVPDIDRRGSAFDAVAARETREMLDDAMDGMPPYYREVLTLRFHEGMSLDEIARVAGAPVSTVKARLRRGLHMLATRLGRSTS